MNKGFYKNDEGNLLYAPNYILFPHAEEWTIENKDEYTYPTLGWYYFDSEEEARIFLNLPLPEPDTETT